MAGLYVNADILSMVLWEGLTQRSARRFSTRIRSSAACWSMRTRIRWSLFIADCSLLCKDLGPVGFISAKMNFLSTWEMILACARLAFDNLAESAEEVSEKTLSRLKCEDLLLCPGVRQELSKSIPRKDTCGISCSLAGANTGFSHPFKKLLTQEPGFGRVGADVQRVSLFEELHLSIEGHWLPPGESLSIEVVLGFCRDETTRPVRALTQTVSLVMGLVQGKMFSVPRSVASSWAARLGVCSCSTQSMSMFGGFCLDDGVNVVGTEMSDPPWAGPFSDSFRSSRTTRDPQFTPRVVPVLMRLQLLNPSS